MTGKDMINHESPPGEGLTYLEEMRLAKMVRRSMPANGRRIALQRTQSASRNLLGGAAAPRRGSAIYLDDVDEESDEDEDKDEGDEEAPVVGGGRRSMMLSNINAWKSMAKHITDYNDDDDLAIGTAADDLDHDGHGHGEGVPFYTKPVQRQLWGDPHLVVHIGWNTLFFDLFYVAAAYNLGNLLISVLNEDQWARGVIYVIGIFGGIYNIFLRCMLYDSQFSVHDYAHRLLEVVRIFLLSVVVLHIKSIDLLRDPKSAESFALTTAMFLETLVHVLLTLELFWFAEGDREAIKNLTKRRLITDLIPLSLIYLSAATVSGFLYFHQENDNTIDDDHSEASAKDEEYHGTSSYGRYDDHRRVLGGDAGATATETMSHLNYDWNIADVPIILCFVAVLFFIVMQGISAIRLSPKNPNIRSLIVPMNIDFFVHRFGEFTMLFFGEAVMGLLIVETTESNAYYAIAMIGVLNVVVLQAFKFESEPHGEEGDHCLWRGLRPFFAYSLLTQSLCLGLIAFAVSFKVGLNHILTDQRTQEDTGYGYEDDSSSYTASGYDSAGGYGDYSNSSYYGDDDHDEGYEDEHRIRRILGGAAPAVSIHVIAILYCSSLTIVLASIELMMYSHKGLRKTYSLFLWKSNKNGLGRLDWKTLFGTLFKLGLFFFASTLYKWVERLDVLAAIGFVITFVFAFAKVVEHIMENRKEEMKKIAKSVHKSAKSVHKSVRRLPKKMSSFRSSSKRKLMKKQSSVLTGQTEENSSSKQLSFDEQSSNDNDQSYDFGVDLMTNVSSDDDQSIDAYDESSDDGDDSDHSFGAPLNNDPSNYQSNDQSDDDDDEESGLSELRIAMGRTPAYIPSSLSEKCNSGNASFKDVVDQSRND